MCREYRKGGVSIRYSQERTWYCVDKRVRDKGCKHRRGKCDRPEKREEGDLEAEQGPGKRIRMHAGNYPAGSTQNHPEDRAKQDLYHGSKMRENGHKSTEMHTIIV